MELEDAELRILSLNGTVLVRETLKGNMHSVDLGEFPTGLFIYQVQSEEVVLSGRVVVNN